MSGYNNSPYPQGAQGAQGMPYPPPVGGAGAGAGTGTNNPLVRNSLNSEVELVISAKNLLDRDVLSKSDPVCVLYSKDLRTNSYFEIGRTEQIPNNLNPIWNKKFTLEYRFEERQIFKFAIYDWDGSSAAISEHDYLGSIECSLGEIVAAPGKKFERNLDIPDKFKSASRAPSTIVIVAEELGTSKEVLHLKLNGRKLDKKDLFGKSDPYILISKLMDDGVSWVQVHQTEVVKNNLNPNWKQFSIRVGTLTGGQPERKIRLQVYDWDSDGSSDFIGEVETTYAAFVEAGKGGSGTFPLINLKKQSKKKSYQNSGLLNIEYLRVEEEKSFLDHIQSGVQLHFTVAIDFTASNGEPDRPDSLHYRNPAVDNQYSLAIKSVGEIIQDYDSDKMFPALGFGGRIPPNYQLSHEFVLNGNPQNPFCHGVQGILDAYHHSLNTVQLYGPTYFAPVINHVARFASGYQDGRNYFILLIITDGIICDMDATKDAVINASALPMSIIIVGVGNEDFSAMEFLDSDGKLLSHHGRSATRDIVQFVEMRKYYAAPGAQNYGYNPTASFIQHTNVVSKTELARAVLAELPDQLVLWMKKFNSLRPQQ